MKNLISIPVIIFIFICVFGCGFGTGSNQTANETNRPTNVVKKEEASDEKPIRSTELIQAFRKDKAAANAAYKDKIVLIKGKITNINDVFGVKALNLRDSDDAIGLQTYLANSADVEKVKVGDEVTVRGKVRGDGIDVVDGAVIVKVN